jgi:hypothetical protein
LVRAINGRALAQPTLFYDLKDVFPSAHAKDPRLMKLLDRWVAAVHSGNEQTSRNIRSVVENTFMAGVTSVDYDLAVIGYDPLRRIRDGTIDHISVVGSFQKTLP